MQSEKEMREKLASVGIETTLSCLAGERLGAKEQAFSLLIQVSHLQK